MIRKIDELTQKKVKRYSFFLFLSLAVLITCINLPLAHAKSSKIGWTVTVVEAKGLKDKDWRPRKYSDPYVEVKLFKSFESLEGRQVDISGLSNKKLKEDIFPAFSIPNRYLGKKVTPVKNNTLKPKWNYKMSGKSFPNREPRVFLFRVWDKDSVKDSFLGVTSLVNPESGKTYNLPLKRRRVGAFREWPGKFTLPGFLTVKVEYVKPKVKVPNVVRRTSKQAKQILKSAGFNSRSSVKIYNRRNPLIDRVVNQKPAADQMLEKGSMVNYVVGKRRVYHMPNVLGKKKWQAIRTLKPPFLRLKFIYKSPDVDIPRSKWLRVTEQTPEAGEKIYLDSPITLTVLKPPKDFKIVVPDVVGKELDEARESLRNAKVAGIKVGKKRVADILQNGKVVAQVPSSGTEVPWSDKKPVNITLGWYADGSSLYSATLTDVDQTIDVTFSNDKPENYRLFKINEPGYLALTKEHFPEEGVNPRIAFYRENSDKEFERVGSGYYYFPGAYRVTPGNWVVGLHPEWEVKEDQSYKFKSCFIKEFDPGEPNDSFGQAVLIDKNAELKMGFIGSDDSDYYRFKVEKPGYLEIVPVDIPSEDFNSRLGNKVDVRFDLYNNDREKIGGRYLPNAQWVSEGEYFLRFQGSEEGWNKASYIYSLIFHEQKDVGEPNDSKDRAFEIEVGNSIPVAYHTRDEDYYMLTSDKKGYALVQHDSKLPFTVPFYRYDKEGKQQGAMFYLPAAVKIDKKKLISLAPDTYETGYLVDSLTVLNIGFISEDMDKSEPNDIPEEATRINLNEEIEALMLPRWEKDYYRFTVSQSGKVFIELDSPEDMPGELVPHLPIKGKVLESDGETVIKERFSFPLSLDLTPGNEYILELQQESGLRRFCTQTYRLNISDGSKEETGNEKLPDIRYTTENEEERGCIDIAKEAYQYYLAKEYKKADKLYRKALDCLPNHPVVWNDFGATNYELGNLQTADSALTKAVELEPEYALAWRNLAVISWDNENWDKAVQRASKAAGFNHSDENLRYAAHSYVLAGNDKKGKEKISMYRQAAVYYRKMENPSEGSRKTLQQIEGILEKHSQQF